MKSLDFGKRYLLKARGAGGYVLETRGASGYFHAASCSFLSVVASFRLLDTNGRKSS